MLVFKQLSAFFKACYSIESKYLKITKTLWGTELKKFQQIDLNNLVNT